MKYYLKYFFLFLFIGTLAGWLYSTFFYLKQENKELDKYESINSNIYGNGVRCSLVNENGYIIENFDDIKINDRTCKIKVHIDNLSKKTNIKFKIVVLINSNKVDIYDKDSKKVNEFIVDKKGQNDFYLKLKDVDYVLEEATVLLFSEEYNYCFNFCNKENFEMNYEMNLLDSDQIKDGIYINSTCYMDNFNENNVVYSQGEENIIIPIIFKLSNNDKWFKFYLFDEQLNIVLINNKEFLCNKFNCGTYEGELSINNLKEKINKYTLVAVPEGENNYKEYFSKTLTVIGE